MAHVVFICYATANVQVARLALSELEKANVECWFAPRNQLASDDWHAAIGQAIQAAKALVWIASKDSAESTHVVRELYDADALKRPILQVRIEEFELPVGLRNMFAGTHWFDATEDPLESKMQALVQAVKRLLADGLPSVLAKSSGKSFPNLLEHLHSHAELLLSARRIKELAGFNLTHYSQSDFGAFPATNLLQNYPKLVLLGSPGSGKSVLMLKRLRELCLNLKGVLSGRTDSTASPLLVPVHIELGQVTAAGPQHLLELVLDQLAIPRADALASLDRLFENPLLSLHLLLDGLNEVDKGKQKQIVKSLFELEDHLSKRGVRDRLRVTVTSRSYGFVNYFEDRSFVTAEMLPLPPSEIESELSRKLTPVNLGTDQLYRQLQSIDRLPKRDQEALFRTIDAFLSKAT